MCTSSLGTRKTCTRDAATISDGASGITAREHLTKRHWQNTSPACTSTARGIELPLAYRKGNKEFYKSDATFCAAFGTAKASIARMRVRYVEEADPTKQALLEIYVALALGTPFNDFNVH